MLDHSTSVFRGNTRMLSSSLEKNAKRVGAELTLALSRLNTCIALLKTSYFVPKWTTFVQKVLILNLYPHYFNTQSYQYLKI